MVIMRTVGQGLSVCWAPGRSARALSLYIQAENVKRPLFSFLAGEDLEVQEGKDLDKKLRLEQIFLDSASSSLH